MPGRTPQEAQVSFIEPLKLALSCLGPAKLTIPASKSLERSWTLNSLQGMDLENGFHLSATMHYEIVQEDGIWRVHTLAYFYDLTKSSTEVFGMHWHPDRASAFADPHLHLGLKGGPADLHKEHLRTGRLTFEHAVEWIISLGHPPAREDWETVLSTARQAHIDNRTWHDSSRGSRSPDAVRSPGLTM